LTSLVVVGGVQGAAVTSTSSPSVEFVKTVVDEVVPPPAGQFLFFCAFHGLQHENIC